jgi:hypothetical protein
LLLLWSTLEMTEEDLDKSKVFKEAAEKLL